MKTKKQKNAKAFTLIELLVVIAIIALLLGILMPGLNKARMYGRAVVSMSNMRQWGIGAMMFTDENKSKYPWEGNKNDNMGENFNHSDWWANAIPPYVGQETYRTISERAVKNKSFVPLPPATNSIFIDPAAKFPDNFTKNAVVFYDRTWPGGYEYQLFFCYVWNSEMNNGPTANILDDIENVKATDIRKTTQTALMLEMRTTSKELETSDYRYYREAALLGRHRGDWKRIARRHLDGAHIVFCDGHVQRVKYDWATANRQGSRDPDYAGGDWNKNGLIWNAFGPSLK